MQVQRVLIAVILSSGVYQVRQGFANGQTRTHGGPLMDIQDGNRDQNRD